MPYKVRDFTRVGDAIPLPSLTAIQTRSYEDFLQARVPPERREPRGLEALFRDVFPIRSPDGSLTVEYLHYTLRPPAHTEEECRRLRLTYGHALHARFRLVGPEVVEDDVYLGEIPKMSGGGEFTIRGAERVVVSQIQRSPGVDFAVGTDSNERKVYSCRIVPERGTWIEFSIGTRGVLTARLGRSGKVPGTWLLRALLPEAGSDGELLALFYPSETVPLGESVLDALVGRYLAGEILNAETGEVLARAGVPLDVSDLRQLMRGGLTEISVLTHVEDPVILNTLQKDPTHSHEEAVLKIYARFRPGVSVSPKRAVDFLRSRLQDVSRYCLGPVGRFRLNRKLGLGEPADLMTLSKEDVLCAVRYLVGLRQERGEPDDIDHLGNRLLRPVGKLAEVHLREGFLRLRRTIENSMALLKGGTTPSPRMLCDSRAITDALAGFFGRGELSQVVDQTNPLSQLANERRVSALGPGGLNRKRAGFEVRDVHPSHYGRLCPIETPEGPNIGLISYLSLFADVDQYGFLTTPYRRLNGRQTRDKDEARPPDAASADAAPIEYLRADQEGSALVAPASAASGKANGHTVLLRQSGDFVEADRDAIDLVDVSPKQLVGVSGSLIPFLEHNDANRALMGSNMQRQAVPLVSPDPPLVFTGMERAVAASSGMVVCARHGGVVTEVDAARIVVDDDEYCLRKFRGLNEGTCLNQRPIVKVGQQVREGQALADGPATRDGELALGMDMLVAFVPFDGYNFEDAVLINERLVREDCFTSVHIEEFEAEVRETKLGREEFTADIPNVGAEALAHLGDDGVVRLGTFVRESDILVGKVTPKPPRPDAKATAEDMLVRAIFGRAGEDVKDDSLRVPPGAEGVVIDVAKFSRKVYLDEAERRRSHAEAQEVRRDFEQSSAELFRALLNKLGALPLAAGGQLPTPAEGASVRDHVRAAEAFEFSPEVFDASVRDRAAEVCRWHAEQVAERVAERDRRLRRIRLGDDLPPGVLAMVKVYVAVKRKVQVGDKVAGRHGNKGVVARVLPGADMPFLPDGRAVDVILNPLGVPSRMNVGQILETHLGWAAHTLGFRALTPIFDGATESVIRDCLEEAGLPRTGKSVLYDGRTGEPFGQEATVGYMYMLKLDHLVEDKTHARATGPYSLITQQPLGGKSRRGGQRVGEMEVWAIEAYGAAHVLQEMMTVKSDDVEGRAAMYESLIKGRHALVASQPVSFQVLVNEIRGLCLDMRLVEVPAPTRNAVTRDDEAPLAPPDAGGQEPAEDGQPENAE